MEDENEHCWGLNRLKLKKKIQKKKLWFLAALPTKTANTLQIQQMFQQQWVIYSATRPKHSTRQRSNIWRYMNEAKNLIDVVNPTISLPFGFIAPIRMDKEYTYIILHLSNQQKKNRNITNKDLDWTREAKLSNTSFDLAVRNKISNHKLSLAQNQQDKCMLNPTINPSRFLVGAGRYTCACFFAKS